MHRRAANAAHLVDGDVHAELSRLPRGLTPGESPANDMNHHTLDCFHQPLLKITPLTTASVENATVIAMNTPCGPMSR